MLRSIVKLSDVVVLLYTYTIMIQSIKIGPEIIVYIRFISFRVTSQSQDSYESLCVTQPSTKMSGYFVR